MASKYPLIDLFRTRADVIRRTQTIETEAVDLERVTGVGGVFFKARDPKALADWYREHLAVPIEDGQAFGVFASQGAHEHTVWAAFPDDTDYFGGGGAEFMINFRMRDKFGRSSAI